MYRNLLAAVSPPTPSPMPSSAPEGPDASSSWRARKGPPSRGDEVAPPPGGAVVGGGAFSKAGASAEGSDRVPGEVGNDQGVRGGEGDHCVESDGGGGSAEGSCDAEALGNGGGSSDVLSAAATGEGSERGVVASDGVASTASAEVGADTDGGAGERRDGPGRGNGSSWAPPPFDLVVVDMGSLAGLDFAQKLVRGGGSCREKGRGKEQGGERKEEGKNMGVDSFKWGKLQTRGTGFCPCLVTWF